MSSYGRRIRMGTATLAAAVLLLVRPAISAQRPRADEDGVKAAFLYNFTKFIEWPSSAFADGSSPFVVCAYADASFRQKLEEILLGEQVRGRPITVAAVGEDPRGCHLLYFSKEESVRQAGVLSKLRQAPVLSVGEGRLFLEQGGLIAFMLEDDRVRFAISKRGADAAGLTISSQLLRVARPFDRGLTP